MTPDHQTSSRVIVCGGRDFDHRDELFAVLDAHHAEDPIHVVIHGNARGADILAGEWARLRGVQEWSVPANWARDGKRAGPLRNERMAGMGAKLVIAFPGGRGTADMVRRAKSAGIPVAEVYP